jgi:peptidoglycan/LPS O-acetylase OafA/YrhL
MKHEIKPLTGIRGLAAYWVIIYHYQADLFALLPGVALLKPVFSTGGLGVDIFFVLSGFIISMVYGIEKHSLSRNGYGRFLVNRIARIYPVYVTCFLLLFALVIADRLLGKGMTNPSDYPLQSAFWHITMLQAWPFVPAVWRNWNAPAWSVSAEWFAYLFLFPLSTVIAAKPWVTRHSAWIGFGLLALFALASKSVDLGSWYFVAQISAQYGCGCMAYLVYKHRPALLPALHKSEDVIVFAFFACVCLTTWHSEWRWGAVFLTPLVILGATREQSLTGRLLATKAMRFLGAVSYSLYLFHELAARLLHVVLPVGGYIDAGWLARAAVFSAYLLVPLAAAAILYYAVEEPCRQKIRGWMIMEPSQTR